MKVSKLITLLQTKTQNSDIVLADYDFNDIWKDLVKQDVFVTEYKNVVYLHSENMDIETKYEDRKLRIVEEITNREDKITKLKKNVMS